MKDIIKELLAYLEETYVSAGLFLLEKLLKKLYIKNSKNFDSWLIFWIDHYLNCFNSKNQKLKNNIVVKVNPILSLIDPKSSIFLIKKVENQKINYNFFFLIVFTNEIKRQKHFIIIYSQFKTGQK